MDDGFNPAGFRSGKSQQHLKALPDLVILRIRKTGTTWVVRKTWDAWCVRLEQVFFGRRSGKKRCGSKAGFKPCAGSTVPEEDKTQNHDQNSLTKRLFVFVSGVTCF
jgi:hypothetical protein